MEQQETPFVMRLPSVKKATGLGRSTIYRMIAKNEFPAQRQLCGRSVGWSSEDVYAWIAQRPQVLVSRAGPANGRPR